MDRSDKWNVSIDNIIPFKSKKRVGVIIEWSGNIGFGEYTIYKKNDKWYGESECMDRGEDKAFLKYLLNRFAENVEIIR